MMNLSSFNSIRIEIRFSDFKSLLAYDSSLLPFWIHSEEKLKVLELAINNLVSRLSKPRQATEDILRLMANFFHRNMAGKGYKSIKEINDTNGSYRIRVRELFYSATARATAFEEVASILMKKSAAELIAMDSKENGSLLKRNSGS
ncbi:hypothetical protein IFM89_002639 [Coptis chinensis]|uniref:Uncharacterized protein n=1 Tax=Coptis chinensis TaxID=261450 RepID=A0A835IJ76_9MAGN|nr:hypothetical protein IFM89_002639 [Coptis chinensis]